MLCYVVVVARITGVECLIECVLVIKVVTTRNDYFCSWGVGRAPPLQFTILSAVFVFDWILAWLHLCCAAAASCLKQLRLHSRSTFLVISWFLIMRACYIEVLIQISPKPWLRKVQVMVIILKRQLFLSCYTTQVKWHLVHIMSFAVNGIRFASWQGYKVL